MLFQNIISILAASTAATAAATKRARTCTFSLYSQRTQNPVSGGDNTLNCGATLDYGDGRVEKLTDNCYDVAHDHCYNSQLPNRICIHTNFGLTDGYLDYGAEHRDFNEPGCEHTGGANPTGDKDGITCHFPCN